MQLPILNSSRYLPTYFKLFQVVQQNSDERGKSLSPPNYAIKAKVNNDDVPERDTNVPEIKETNLETASGGGQLVTNVVIGEDSGFQILSTKDEEAEREKPRKVISTKIHKKKVKSIHDHR